MCNPVNTLPNDNDNDNDNGHGAAEIARGEMSCNDGYALHEMIAATHAVSARIPADFKVNTLNSTAEASS
jgi:hypothetical protein